MLENEERKTVRNVFLMLIEVGRVELARVREYCPGGSDILIKKALYILHVMNISTHVIPNVIHYTTIVIPLHC